MALDIFYTHHLIAAYKLVTPPTTFLRDRYFPTNEATDLFASEDVLIEYKDGNRKVAPFVSPRKGGVTILRDGSHMVRYTPPFVAPRRTLTIDELKRRGFGEALMSNVTPQQRESLLVMQDMEDLDQLITRREEVMAAEILTTNKCVVKEYADDMTVADEKEIRFFEGTDNPATYVPSVKWGEEGANIIEDMDAMRKMLTKKGYPATEMLVASDVADIILNDEKVQKKLDIRNYNIGSIAPMELPDGVTRIAVLNVKGADVTILCYAETYENEEGVDTPYIPAGTVVMTAPAVGRTMYGAITQMEQHDNLFHTYTGKRIPKYVADAKGNTREITLSSAPLLVPNKRNSFISAKVTA